MKLHRRDFIRLLGLGVISQELDIERLLWVPGAKKIFITPSIPLKIDDIVALEIDMMAPRIAAFFAKDDVFYKLLKSKQPLRIEGHQIPIPFEKK